MYVPSYVPEQIEIPGNVAEARWSIVVGFVRRVLFLHFLTLLCIILIGYLPIGAAPLEASLPLLAASLIGLSIMRNIGKGKSWEQILSALAAPTLFISLGQIVAHFGQHGWPAWSISVGPAVAVAYVVIAGRDLSFLGMFVFSAGVSSVVLCVWSGEMGRRELFQTLAVNLAYLFFYVYDAAAILTRRRLGEDWGAVLDLYRDTLNFITYPLRVWKHWRKHRIWSIPKL